MMRRVGMREELMASAVREILAGIATVGDMVAAFRDEETLPATAGSDGLAAGSPVSHVWMQGSDGAGWT